MNKFSEDCMSIIEALFDLTRKFATSIARGKISGDMQKEIKWKLEWVAKKMDTLGDE